MAENLPLDKLDSAKKRDIAVQALESLDLKDKRKVIKLACGLGLPDQPATNFVWKLIVISFAIVLVGSFLFLAFAIVFLQKTPADLQMLLTMFTLVVGFFAGLLSPSPAHKT